MLTLFAHKEKADQSRRIKQWLNDLLNLPDTVIVLVAEMICNDPDCAPLETVITIWYTDTHSVQAKIFKPLVCVTYEDMGNVLYQLTLK